MHFDAILNYEQRDSRCCLHEISALLQCYCRSLLVSYRRFGTAYRSRLQGWCTLGLLDRWRWASMLSRNVGNHHKATRRTNVSYRGWSLKSRLRALHSPVNRMRQQHCWRRSEQFMWQTPLCWRRTRVQQSDNRSQDQWTVSQTARLSVETLLGLLVRQPGLASRPSWGSCSDINVVADFSVTRFWSVRCSRRAGLPCTSMYFNLPLYTPADSCLDYLQYTRGGEVAEAAQRCKCRAVCAGLSNAGVQYKFCPRTTLLVEGKVVTA